MLCDREFRCLRIVFAAMPLFAALCTACAHEPVNIGSRLEPLFDNFLIEAIEGGAELKLHQPVSREVAITFDEPWEGNASGYPTVFQDGDIYRMYYRGHRYVIDDPPFRQAQSEAVCYAESKDGIHWTKPNLGLHKWPGVGTE